MKHNNYYDLKPFKMISTSNHGFEDYSSLVYLVIHEADSLLSNVMGYLNAVA